MGSGAKRMWMRMFLVLAGLLFVAQPALASLVAIQKVSLKDSRKWERQGRREWGATCRKFWANRKNPASVLADKVLSPDRLAGLADRFQYGDYGCRRDLPLAIKVMEHAVGANPLAADQKHVRQLIALHDLANRPESEVRGKELKRLLWVGGGFYRQEVELGWSETERLAFVARDDVWTYISSQRPGIGSAYENVAVGLLNPASPRYDPARGIDLVERWRGSVGKTNLSIWAARLLIDGAVVPKDAARAETILLHESRYSDDARTQVLTLIAPRLDSQDPATRNAAFHLLESILTNIAINYGPSTGTNAIRTRLVPHYASLLNHKDGAISQAAAQKLAGFVEARNESAAQPLLTWLVAKMRGASLADKKPEWHLLTRLARAGNPQARELLEADIKRTGGLVDVSAAESGAYFSPTFITSDDYPPSAQRNEEDGIVSAFLLVAPGGAIIEGFVTKSATPHLDSEVIKFATRRIRNLSFPKYPGRYVRLQLPDVQFQLDRSCNGGGELKPGIPGAIVVNSTCRKPIIYN